MKVKQPKLINLQWHKKTKRLTLEFDDQQCFELNLEYLRVFSPSAEVQGHGPGQETLVSGKRFVDLNKIEPVGNYAIKLVFDDGHDSGLYTWAYLHQLGAEEASNWKSYLKKIADHGFQREPKDLHILKL